MKIAYFISRLSLSGGTLVLAEHVRALNGMGHDAHLVCLQQDDGFDFKVPVERVPNLEGLLRLGSDLVIASHPMDVTALYGRIRNLVFLVQGKHVEELEVYYQERAKARRYEGLGGRLVLKMRKWRDMKRMLAVYRLPVSCWCVSPGLRLLLRDTYGIEARLIRNPIDRKLCYPEPRTGRITLVCIADHRQPFKNIPFALRALQDVRVRRHLHIIHISSGEPLDGELASMADERHARLSRTEVAAICRRAHILLSPSLMEGFGLPVVEGMACGMLCLLSDIPDFHAYHFGQPEIAEPYALYFNPRDMADIAKVTEDACMRYGTPEMEKIRANGQSVAGWYSENGMCEDLSRALQAFGSR